jgi:hypothetical protein
MYAYFTLNIAIRSYLFSPKFLRIESVQLTYMREKRGPFHPPISTKYVKLVTMALGATQPLTKMSTRIISWG